MFYVHLNWNQFRLSPAVNDTEMTFESLEQNKFSEHDYSLFHVSVWQILTLYNNPGESDDIR